MRFPFSSNQSLSVSRHLCVRSTPRGRRRAVSLCFHRLFSTSFPVSCALRVAMCRRHLFRSDSATVILFIFFVCSAFDCVLSLCPRLSQVALCVVLRCVVFNPFQSASLFIVHPAAAAPSLKPPSYPRCCSSVGFVHAIICLCSFILPFGWRCYFSDANHPRRTRRRFTVVVVFVARRLASRPFRLSNFLPRRGRTHGGGCAVSFVTCCVANGDRQRSSPLPPVRHFYRFRIAESFLVSRVAVY